MPRLLLYSPQTVWFEALFSNGVASCLWWDVLCALFARAAQALHDFMKS